MLIDVKEKWFVIIITCLVLGFSFLPQIIGYFIKKDKYFLFVPICNSADTISHLSWVKQGKECNILFENKYTTEKQRKIIFHPLFLFLGKVARIFDLSPVQIFILFKVLSTTILMVVLYLLISFIIYDKFLRKVVFSLIAFSSGLGGYLVLFDVFQSKDIITSHYPIDLWCPEAVTFFGIYISPLITFSLALIVLIFWLYLFSLKDKKIFFLICAGFLNLLLGLIHPYDVFITISVILVYSFYKILLKKNKDVLLYALVFIILTLPVLSYQYFCIMTNPVFKIWLSSSRYSPSSISILAGYGFLIPFVIASFIKKRVVHDFLSIWLFTICTIIFLPVSFQRRLIEGLHIPVCLISTPSIVYFARKYFADYKKAIRIFVILSSFTNISILTSDIKEYIKTEFPYYIEKEIIQGFNFLDKNTKKDEIILPLSSADNLIFPSYSLGNLIPAFSGNNVFFGHYDLTIDIEKKIKNTKEFVSGEIKEKFLKESSIKYIFLLSKENIFLDCSFLSIVYSNRKVKIYEFIKR